MSARKRKLLVGLNDCGWFRRLRFVAQSSISPFALGPYTRPSPIASSRGFLFLWLSSASLHRGIWMEMFVRLAGGAVRGFQLTCVMAEWSTFLCWQWSRAPPDPVSARFGRSWSKLHRKLHQVRTLRQPQWGRGRDILCSTVAVASSSRSCRRWNPRPGCLRIGNYW